MYTVYVGAHQSLEKQEKKNRMPYGILYAILHQFKVMGGSEEYNRHISDKFRKQDQFQFFIIENSYRVQILIETVLETIPQIII